MKDLYIEFVKTVRERPFKILAFLAIIFAFIAGMCNLFGIITYENTVYPAADMISLIVEIIAGLFFVVSYILYDKHIIYYIGAEILIYQCLYCGRIYLALFLSSILLALIFTEKISAKPLYIIIYLALEAGKIAITVPYGFKAVVYYVGLSLFALSTISCINLLFRHAYENKESKSLDIDKFKFSDRQKDCIRQIVVNNITIKELALNYKVSESAIKKDLSHIYRVLGITGKADLKALFIGYSFPEEAE